ncbi:MAG: alpha/beta hydrolase-fold protein [Planctomycetota bacterium]
MSKERATWHSDRIGREITLCRWGEVGTPLLIFPTAAGDAEEGERFHLIDAISEHLTNQRVKAYAVDSVAGQEWLKNDNSFQNAGRMQHAFDAVLAEEIVPAIHRDCGFEPFAEGAPRILLAGASIGAFNALATILRHPDLFSTAICMSGTYDIGKWLKGQPDESYLSASPLHFLPNIPEGEHLEKCRNTFVLLTHGTGRWEDPQESWKVANALGARQIPNRVDEWGDEWDHDWITWRDMLPKYLDELLPPAEADAKPEEPETSPQPEVAAEAKPAPEVKRPAKPKGRGKSKRNA